MARLPLLNASHPINRSCVFAWDARDPLRDLVHGGSGVQTANLSRCTGSPDAIGVQFAGGALANSQIEIPAPLGLTATSAVSVVIRCNIVGDDTRLVQIANANDSIWHICRYYSVLGAFIRDSLFRCSSSAPAAGTRTIIVTWPASTAATGITLYSDGAVISSPDNYGGTLGTYSAATRVQIGRQEIGGSAGSFAGGMFSLRIFSRVLDAGEIGVLSRDPTLGFRDSPKILIFGSGAATTETTSTVAAVAGGPTSAAVAVVGEPISGAVAAVAGGPTSAAVAVVGEPISGAVAAVAGGPTSAAVAVVGEPISGAVAAVAGGPTSAAVAVVGEPISGAVAAVAGGPTSAAVAVVGEPISGAVAAVAGGPTSAAACTTGYSTSLVAAAVAGGPTSAAVAVVGEPISGAVAAVAGGPTSAAVAVVGEPISGAVAAVAGGPSSASVLVAGSVSLAVSAVAGGPTCAAACAAGWVYATLLEMTYDWQLSSKGLEGIFPAGVAFTASLTMQDIEAESIDLSIYTDTESETPLQTKPGALVNGAWIFELDALDVPEGTPVWLSAMVHTTVSKRRVVFSVTSVVDPS